MAEFALDDSYLEALAQWEQENAQQLAADTQQKKNKKKEGVVTEAQKALAFAEKLKKIRLIYRGINIFTGVTLYGLIITFLVMNWQLIMSGVEGISMLNGIGKIFGVKFVPSLSIFEFIILLLIWLAIIILGGFIAAVIYFYDKCGGVMGAGVGWSFAKANINTECAQFFK